MIRKVSIGRQISIKSNFCVSFLDYTFFERTPKVSIVESFYVAEML